MSERDLAALLERATADLPDVDLADEAWSDAYAARLRRRRRVTAGVGAVAAGALAVVAVQSLGGQEHRNPPVTTATTPVTTGTLADGTAYAELPLEGKEGELPQLDVGLPAVIDPSDPMVPFGAVTTPLDSVLAVYVRVVSGGYQPVVVGSGGKQYLPDLMLEPTRDNGGNEGVPLGPRAIGDGRYAYFPQPGKVVRLDVYTGAVASYAVPSPYVQSVGWGQSTGGIVVRGDGQTWSLDPDKPHAPPKALGPAAYDGEFRMSADAGNPGRRVVVTRQDEDGQPGTGGILAAPVSETWGETLGTQRWAAVGGFFDQEVTNSVIRRGNGPIYQGVVAVDTEGWRARVLLAPENPDGQTGRYKGCCSVLGWADARTVLLQTVGAHGSWVLAWNVMTGTVSKVTQIDVNPAAEEIPRLALNVGWRY